MKSKQSDESSLYSLQNAAIHKARAQLEEKGILDPWAGLDQIRAIAAELNLGIPSISKLSIDQRRALIDRPIVMGAQVKNPVIYDSYRGSEKVTRLGRVKESQLRMLDALAGKVQWREPDGYARFCHKVIKSPRPRNSREVTTLRIALESMISKESLLLAR